jgi:hypothetical protein
MMLGTARVELARNDNSLNFGRAFVDLRNFGIAKEALDRVILHISISAEDLNGFGRCGHRRFTREELRHRAELRDVLAPILRRRRRVQQCATGADTRRDVREFELNGLKLLDWSSKLAALRGVPRRVSQRGLGDTNRLRRDAKPSVVKRLHSINETASLLPKQVGGRHAKVIEVELHRGRRAQTHLVFFLSDFESRKVWRDDERTDPTRSAPIARCVGARHREDDTRLRSARYPGLGPVEHPAIAIAHGLSAQRRGVGAGIRFGQSERAKLLATRHRPQEAILLLLGSPAQNHLRRKRVMNAHHDGNRRVDRRDLLEGDEIRQRVEAKPIVLLGQKHPQKPKLAELRHHPFIEVLLAIPRLRVRRDFALGELARDALDLALLFGERS